MKAINICFFLFFLSTVALAQNEMFVLIDPGHSGSTGSEANDV